MLLLLALVETIGESREPNHLPHYALRLATAFHDFFERCQVINHEEQYLTSARLRSCVPPRSSQPFL